MYGVNGVIRNITTREYLLEDGTWTLHAGQAAWFNSMIEAVSAVQRFRLRGVEFVYLMGGDSAYDLAFELTDGQSEARPNASAAAAAG